MAKKKLQRVSQKDAEKLLKKYIYNAPAGVCIERNYCPYGSVVYISEAGIQKFIKKLTR